MPSSTNSEKPYSAQCFLYSSKNVCPLIHSFSSIRPFFMRIIFVLPSEEPRHFHDAAHFLSGQWRRLRHSGSQNTHCGVWILPSTGSTSRMYNSCKAISIPSLLVRVSSTCGGFTWYSWKVLKLSSVAPQVHSVIPSEAACVPCGCG